MNKLQSEVDELLRYQHSERDTAILQGIMEYGTLGKLVKHTDFKKRTVQRRLAAMRKSAQQYGLHEEFPEANTILDQPIRGKSRLRKFDPPLPDGTILQWDKTLKPSEVALVEAIKAVCEGFSIPPVPTSAFTYKGNVTRHQLSMLVIADAHLGILARDGWGLRENLELCQSLVSRQVQQMEPVEHALLNNVGDLTHTDGMVAATTKNKNPLDVNAVYYDIARAGAELIAFAIEGLLTKAKHVTYMGVPGNHDFVTAFHITEKLAERYKGNKRVTILDSAQSHIPFIWESNFIVGWHGDTAPNARAYEYITSVWPKECGNAEHIHVAKGHIHHTKEEYVGRACFATYTSSTKTDVYHDFKMFKARRGMTRVDFDPEGGDIGGLIVRPRKGE